MIKKLNKIGFIGANMIDRKILPAISPPPESWQGIGGTRGA